MEPKVFTLGDWKVKKGLETQFISQWEKLGTIFRALPHPPLGKGTLIQSTTDSLQFYSFGEWKSLDDIQEMRKSFAALDGIQELRDLCNEATPGSFRLVAEA